MLPKIIERNVQAFTLVIGSTLAVVLSGMWTEYWLIFVPMPLVAFFAGGWLESHREESRKLKARIERFNKLIDCFKQLLHSNYVYCFYSTITDLTKDGEDLEEWKKGYLKVHKVLNSWLDRFGVSFWEYRSLIGDGWKLAVSIGEFHKINEHFFGCVEEFYKISEKGVSKRTQDKYNDFVEKYNDFVNNFREYLEELKESEIETIAPEQIERLKELHTQH